MKSFNTPISVDRGHGLLQVLLGGFLISFSPVFVKVADVGPSISGFYRMLFGGSILLVLSLLSGKRLWPGWPVFGWILAASIFFFADLWLWHRSILWVGPGMATILANFQVFFLALVGVSVLRERLSWRLALGIGLAMAGLLLLVGIDWAVLGESKRMGVWFGIGTAAMYTGYILTLRRMQRAGEISPVASLALISFATAALLAAEAIWRGVDFYIPNTKSWLALIGYGLFCQALGWIAISRGLAKVEASRVGLVLLVQPTLAFVWDMSLFARSTTSIELTGAVLALGGIYLGNSQRARS